MIQLGYLVRLKSHLNSDDIETIYRLKKATTIIGRDSLQCDIPLLHATVSSKHAEIEIG